MAEEEKKEGSFGDFLKFAPQHLPGVSMLEPDDKPDDEPSEKSDDKPNEAYEEMSSPEDAAVIDFAKNREEIGRIANEVKLLNEQLDKEVLGQSNAIRSFTKGYFRARINSITGYDKGKPAGTFLFAGPPGVGKTFLARQASLHLGIEARMFNMSEYSGPEGVMRFAGTQKGYSGARRGLVTGFVDENNKKHKSCIVIFDEIEKAHEDVIYLLLQMLDGGEVVDAYTEQGVSFRDAIIIFTTNAGHELYQNSEKKNLSGYSTKVILDALKNDRDKETGKPLFPEPICSRFASGNVVMFNHMDANMLYRISKLNMNEAVDIYEKKGIGARFDIDHRLYSTLLFSEGGNSDARMVTGVTRRFIMEEFYELMRLVPDVLEELETVRIQVDVPEDEAIRDLYENKNKSNILVYGDRYEIGELSGYGAANIFVTDDYMAAEELIKENDIEAALVDFAYRRIDNEHTYVNIEDVDSEGRRMYNICKEEDIPVFILRTSSHTYSREEEFSLKSAGIRDIVDLGSGDEKQIIDRMVKVIHQQHSMDYLASANKVLRYGTAQSVSADGRTATLTLMDLRLETAVDAEDMENVMSGASRPDTKLSDVIGAKDAKEELSFFIESLQNPKKYAKLGITAPKGILFYGPPGTGKTMLAKAVAGEANVMFLATEGNKFESKWVGDSAKNVHKLFKAARKYAPSVVFIDEIDAVIKDRSSVGPGQRGTDDIVTALLAEMDGFDVRPDKPVFVIAATNAQVNENGGGLDPAVLRRFDRKIYVDLPDKEERLEYLRRKTADEDRYSVTAAELESLAVRSVGSSIAELENVMNAAVRKAIREQSDKVTGEILDAAYHDYIDGEERENRDEEDVRKTAIHESGHALLHWIHGNTPQYITISARSNYGGYVLLSNESKGTYTRTELEHKIEAMLAGRAAEMVYYGLEKGVTTGPSNDLEQATALARAMMFKYGMYDEIGLSVMSEREMMEGENSLIIKQKTDELLKDALYRVIAIINSNRSKVDAMVERLIKENHLNGQQIEDVFGNS